MMGTRPGLSRWGVLALVALVALVGALAAPSSALAQSAWWHLTSGTRPANLEPGQGKDEVQEVTVNATGGFFYLVEKRAGVPNFEKFTRLPFDATVSEVQEALRSEVYPYRQLTVAEGKSEENTRKYIVTFPGQSVEPMEKLTFELSGAAKSLTVDELGRGRPAGKLVVTAANLGDADVDGATTPVELGDEIPAGLQAVAVEGKVPEAGGTLGGMSAQCALGSLACTFTGKVAPYDQIEMLVSVVARPGVSSGEVNQASVSGGGATPASVKRPVSLGGAPSFGVEDYEMVPEEAGGGIDTQAGSHPFQLTTTLALNQDAAGKPAALAKDLDFKLPPGLIGNPTPFPQCTLAQFQAKGPLGGSENLCPGQTAVGAVQVTVEEPKGLGVIYTFSVPLFNLEPAVGEPARFGFTVIGAQVLLDTSVRTGGDYGVTVTVRNISQTAGFTVSQVTFWGVPGDPRHDAARGWACMQIAREGESAGPCKPSEALHPPPLLTLPTSCTGPLQTSVEADSWADAGSFASFPSEPMQALDGCNRLQFSPSISVTPDGQAGSTPTGLTVGVHVPQDVSLDAEGLSEADVKDTTVALPAGVVLNPAAADGLLACSEAQIALSVDGVPSCPEASKVATVEIQSPLLPNPLVGEVYLAAQNENPFGSLVALYLVARDPVSGTLVKLAGEVKPDPVTGQLVSTFLNTPQLPFEDLKLHFFGGSRAPLATPALCGSYTTTASIAPWSGNETSQSSSTFQVTSGPNGAPCASPLPFNPELTAGSLNIQAGAFTPFTTTMSRTDGQQSLQGIVLHMPPGLSGLLSGVKLCGETEGNMGTCSPESLIGETIVSVGVGGTPYSVKGGRVYITGPYHGAPFGLSIVNPAKAGPYDLEKSTPCDCVVVRARIEVDPVTAALTVTTDNTGPYKIPTIIDGIPLQIQHVNVTVNRPGFTFNPTNCDPMKITGGLQSTEGSSQALSVPFQVTNCATLGFKPQFSVSTSGKTSRANGASLHVKLAYPKAPFGSQANIKRVKVDLPKQLPSRLTTLQKACTSAQFEANPAGCPAASIVGHAKAITPLIPVPLEGPAYFVSHGGAKFPELILVLQGYGVTIDLHGETFISPAGITSSTFATVPDAPVGSFELTLPQGKFSALAANGNLCKTKLKMPTAFTAQNGATTKQSTPIGVTGCTRHKQRVKKAKKVAKHPKRIAHGKK
jgi:hypothetical protein